MQMKVKWRYCIGNACWLKALQISNKEHVLSQTDFNYAALEMHDIASYENKNIVLGI